MKTIRPAVFLVALLPFAAACGDKDGDTGSDDGLWMPYCESTETVLDAEDVSPLGFSAKDLLTAVGDEVLADLYWIDGGSTVLRLGLAPTGSVTFVDLEVAEPPDDAGAIADIGVVCDDYLAVGATMSLISDDGLLSDGFAVELTATTAASAGIAVRAERADFDNPEIFDPALGEEYDEEHVSIYGSVSAGGNSQGEIALITSGVDGETAWQSSTTVASWEADGER